jgi:hypothetical protein
MAWTTTDLEKLERAMATGARRVKFGDVEQEFRSLTEMRSLRDEMRKELGLVSSGSRRVYPEFDKGLEA